MTTTKDVGPASTPSAMSTLPGSPPRPASDTPGGPAPAKAEAAAGRGVNTYTELFRTPEFTPFFAASALQVAATTVRGLALATLVFARTGSPLLAALAMFGPSIAQVLSAMFLLSAADRLPPRAATAATSVLFAASTAVVAVPGLPLSAIFGVLIGNGLVTAIAGGVRYGLLTRILPADGYLLGRSVLNMATGMFQILGFAGGGVLITVVSPRGALTVSAALFLASALAAALGLSGRPSRAAGRPSATETWRVNAELLSLPRRRRVYIALWVPNGLVVGCESLFVSYDARHAGLLFAVGAFGMLIGDTAFGRFIPRDRRDRLAFPLLVLLAAPFLLFAAHLPLVVAASAAGLSAIGYASSLVQQGHLVDLTPERVHGQALGLHSAGMMAMQGVGAAVAGAVAQRLAPGSAMAVMAVLSLAVTAWLAFADSADRVSAG